LVDLDTDKENGNGEQDMDITMQATNPQADKTTAVNPMKELRIEKLVISQCNTRSKGNRKLMK
jgi:ribosomal protein L5